MSDMADQASPAGRGWIASLAQPYVVLPGVALLLAGMLWATVLNVVRLERAAAENSAMLLSREVVETYEAQVVRALREIDQTLKVVKLIHESGGGKVLAALKARGILPPELLFTVRIADRDGRIVESTHADAASDIAGEDYFATHRGRTADDIAIGQPPQDQTGEGKLIFSRRLASPDGGFAGVVAVSVNAYYFVSGYETAKLGHTGMLGLIGLDGVFRVRRSGETIRSGDIGDYRAALEAGDAPAQSIAPLTNDWDGVRRYTAARELYDFPVAVIVGVAADEQLAPVGDRAHIYILGAAIGSIVLLLVFGALARMSLQLARSRQRETEATLAHARQVEYLAYHDALTGLPNRSLLSKLLTQAITGAQRNNRSLAVLFLDLDRFKTINDTLGHDAGDELLREVARRLKACLRDSDVVARLGGDEFVVLLPELSDARYAAAVAQKILAATAQPFTLLGNEFSVTASIGISTCPQDGLDEQTLTKNADIAMYHAKEQGKNNFQFYSAALSADALQRLTLENSLRHALERDEFRLHYQARRDTASGAISGMEALLRWEHPDLGTIAPMQFLPLAEETGLVIPIGRWVLRTACEQNVAWQREGLPQLVVSVNLSPRQFFDEHLLDEIRDVLASSGLAPQWLELEITESLLMQDVEQALQVLAGLKDIGVRIAIDDFGVGYSSLATLERFPIDTVKIDRSFIREADHFTAGATLTSAVIAMGKSLSLNVVAQGVETREQADYLHAHACDEFQGFYFDKPLPAGQFAGLLQAQQRTEADP